MQLIRRVALASILALALALALALLPHLPLADLGTAPCHRFVNVLGGLMDLLDNRKKLSGFKPCSLLIFPYGCGFPLFLRKSIGVEVRAHMFIKHVQRPLKG